MTENFQNYVENHQIPQQVYRYGASIGFYGVSYVITMVVTSEVFLPIFYRLGVTSTYEVRATTTPLLCWA